MMEVERGTHEEGRKGVLMKEGERGTEEGGRRGY